MNRTSVLSYIDGIAVTALAYVLSPPVDALRNSFAIGFTHFLLHEYAAHYMMAGHAMDKAANRFETETAANPNSFNHRGW